jgi:hypothetical protein
MAAATSSGDRAAAAGTAAGAASVTETVRGEVLGVPVDLDIATEFDAVTGVCTVTCSMLLPHIEYDTERNILNVWPPPLKPLPPTKEERLFERM